MQFEYIENMKGFYAPIVASESNGMVMGLLDTSSPNTVVSVIDLACLLGTKEIVIREALDKYSNYVNYGQSRTYSIRLHNINIGDTKFKVIHLFVNERVRYTSIGCDMLRSSDAAKWSECSVFIEELNILKFYRIFKETMKEFNLKEVIDIDHGVWSSVEVFKFGG